MRDAADVLEDLGVRPPGPVPSPTTRAGTSAAGVSREPGGAGEHAGRTGEEAGTRCGASDAVLALLAEGPLDAEELARTAGLEPGVLARVMVELELAGCIRQERDGRVHRVWT